MCVWPVAFGIVCWWFARYINNDRVTLNFDGMVQDLEAAPEGTIVLLHACAHNPTGEVVEISVAAWRDGTASAWLSNVVGVLIRSPDSRGVIAL